MATLKANRAITFAYDQGVIKFASSHGDTFSFNLAALGDEAREQALVFGVARKVVNGAALDAGATVAEKWAGVLEVAQRLSGGGAWNSSDRTTKADVGGLVIAAIMRVYNETAEKAEATIANYMTRKGVDRKAALATWGASNKVSAMVKVIKEEREASRLKGKTIIDSDSLFKESLPKD
jgi:hypothetical protein